jgi:hypothetical protein
LVDDDPDRFGVVEALGLDEVLFCRIGPWRRQEFSTQFVDVGRGQLLDVVPGRSGKEPIKWLEAQGKHWRDQVRYATLDLSGPYRAVFDAMVPDATQVADPFHVCKLANTKLDECRRRVQNETMGHRGHKADPLYRCRRLLTKADERLDDHGREKLLGLLRAGDPKGDVTTMWHAKEAVRALYSHQDPELALEWVERLAADLNDTDYPIEARSLSRTLIRWKHQIAAWHEAHVSNGPTEAVILWSPKAALAGRVIRGSTTCAESGLTLGSTSIRGCKRKVFLTRQGHRLSGDGDDVELANRYLHHLYVRGFAAATVRTYAFHLLSFLRFEEESGLDLVGTVPTVIFDFIEWLGTKRSTTAVVVVGRSATSSGPTSAASGDGS